MDLYRQKIPLHDLTTLRIGGPGDWYTEPASAGALLTAISWAKERDLPPLLLGRGSNLLVSDEGWPGLVINLRSLKRPPAWSGKTVVVDAGTPLDDLVRDAIGHGYAGMEELSGIPGTVGGAVVMNAGAYGSAVSDTLVEATYCDMRSGEMITLEKPELSLGYRTSIFQRLEAVVLLARFSFHEGVKDELTENRRNVLSRRRKMQPLEQPNCGSVFKRPQNDFAGSLIERCGLKGLRNGGAAISEKHANFIVNLGGGTAAEVRHLIVHCQRTVYERFGILLEPEVVFAGAFEEPLFEPST